MEAECEWDDNSLPYDIIFKILTSLQVEDVCSLGSCSKLFREYSLSDSLWISLYTNRWPHLDSDSNSKQTSPSAVTNSTSQFSPLQGWRSFYMERHNEMAGRANSLIRVVNQCSTSESIEVLDYQKAIADLRTMEMGFKDVIMFLFAQKQNVLLNLIGIHYLIFWLGIPVDNVVNALMNSNISERQVCVKWWKLGRWMFGYRLRDESHSRKVSLAHLALGREEEVFGVLKRGAVHEVLRVQISVPNITSIHWTCRNSATMS